MVITINEIILVTAIMPVSITDLYDPFALNAECNKKTPHRGQCDK